MALDFKLVRRGIVLTAAASSLMGLVACSGFSSDNENDSGIAVPVYQKGLSQNNQAEFLAAVEQIQVLFTEMGVNSTQIQKVVADVRAHSFQGGQASEDRSAIGDYTNVVTGAKQNCTRKQRTEDDPRVDVDTLSIWYATQNPETPCKLELGFSRRTSRSTVTGRDIVGAIQEAGSLRLVDQKERMKDKDIMSVRFDRTQDSYVDTIKQKDFNSASKQIITDRVKVAIVWSDGSNTSLELVERTDMRSQAIDDAETRVTGSHSLTFVYRGTSNPVVYELVDTYPGVGKNRTEIKLNGDQIFATKN